ncbi:MAG TPA: hypothetical protein VGY58_24135, partial [Gemmataceae bacterium]|nr:hypothetical protein [Gemmataceae bacterium]
MLLRDPRAGIILLAMPFIFILVLGLSLGEGFGQKPDDRMRVSLVDLDQGYAEPSAVLRETMVRFAQTPGLGGTPFAALTLAGAQQARRFPQESWASVVQRDLAETAGIRVEVIASRAEAEDLVA